MPNTSVSPLATRNSTIPYCTPFSSWTAKLARSMRRIPKSERRGRDGLALQTRLCSGRHAAAERRIREIGVSDRDVAIQAALHLAQIDVLHGVVRLGEAQGAARAVDLGGRHGGDHLRARRGIALHGIEADAEQRAGVVALHRIDVADLAGLLLERREEGLVDRIVEIVRIMQR